MCDFKIRTWSLTLRQFRICKVGLILTKNSTLMPSILLNKVTKFGAKISRRYRVITSLVLGHFFSRTLCISPESAVSLQVMRGRPRFLFLSEIQCNALIPAVLKISWGKIRYICFVGNLILKTQLFSTLASLLWRQLTTEHSRSVYFFPSVYYGNAQW